MLVVFDKKDSRFHDALNLFSGKVKLNTLPFVHVLSTLISPFIKSARRRQIARPKPVPFVISRQTGFNLPERLKQGLEIIWLYPYPCVGNGESDGSLAERAVRRLEIRNQFGLQRDLTAIGKLDGIIKEVQQNLFNSSRVSDRLIHRWSICLRLVQDLSFQQAALQCPIPG